MKALISNTYIRILIFGLLYYVSGRLGLTLKEFEGVTLIWPPAGISILLMLMWGKKIWPGIIIGVGLLAFTLPEMKPEAALFALPGNIAEPLIGTWLIIRYIKVASLFKTAKSVWLFLLVAVLVPLTASVSGSLVFYLTGQLPVELLFSSIGTWWLGNLIGILLFTPLFVYQDPDFHPGEHNRYTQYTGLLLAFFLLLTIIDFFVAPQFLQSPRALLYLPFALSIWMTTLFGIRGAVYTNLVITIFATYSNKFGELPFTATLQGDVLQILSCSIIIVVNYLLAAIFFERYQISKALKHSEERFRSAFYHAPIGVALVRPDGYFLQVNDTICEMLGYSGDELLTLSPTDVTYKEDLPETEKQLGKVLSGEAEAFSAEKRYIKKDGTVIWTILNTSLQRDDQNNPLYFISQLLDITALKQATLQIKNNNDVLQNAVTRKTDELNKLHHKMLRQHKLAAVGQVSASIAHELRNPLGAVRQSIYFLRRKKDGFSEKVLKHLNLIDKEISHADQVITNMLDISREKKMTFSAFSLKEILPAILDRISTENIDVDVNISDEIIMWGDAFQISQALFNLIMNAVQSIAPPGKITVSAMQDHQDVTILIEDTGKGIKEGDLETIFEPLFTSKATGTGLGLTISKDIVELHSGQVLVQSTYGKGTKIAVIVPHKVNQTPD